MIHDAEMRPRTGSHVLVSTPLPEDAVFAIAGQEGLQAASIDTGLFQFIKVWVEETVLVELLTPRQLPAYLASFGPAGARTLEAKFRDLEHALSRRATH
jgi:hypothetical protein